MSQSDLYVYLKRRNGQLFDTLHLGNVVGGNRQNVSRCAKQLEKMDPNIVVIPANHPAGRKGILIKYDDSPVNKWKKVRKSLIELGETKNMGSILAKI